LSLNGEERSVPMKDEEIKSQTNIPIPSGDFTKTEQHVPVPAGLNTPFSRYFFATFAVLVLIAFLLLIKPFLTDIFLAFVLFVLFSPLYDLIVQRLRGWRAVSSLITCLLIIVIIFLPFLIFTGVLATSAYNFYQYLNEAFKNGQLQQLLNFKDSPIVQMLIKYIPSASTYDFNTSEVVSKYLGTVSQFIYTNTRSIVTGVSTVFIGFILIMFIAFYLFIDGRSFLEEFKRLSPLDRRYSQEIIDELFKTIKLTFKGSLVIAVVQGILGATGFLLCGIDSWALWGTVMVLASLIPVVGTALIWGPAAIFQAVTGHLWAAGFIVFWGVAVIGLADNLLRPQLLKGDTNIHPLFIFFSVMGGLSYFGFLGIILGPLILSLLVYILTMYKKFINPQPLKIDT
jgi:predicted PurR-regulated permease PerM